MADFPLAINLQGDYGFKVVVVDDNDTIENVIKTATNQIVGILVAPFPPETQLKARVHGSDETLPSTTTVKAANLVQMEAIEIVAES